LPTETPTPTATFTATPTPTNTPLPSNTPTPTNTPELGYIFGDNFETGNLDAWSITRTDGGDLFVSSAAALVGNSGLQAVIDDTRPLYLEDRSPNLETNYRTSFYFDPNSISMAQGNHHVIFQAYTDANGVATRIALQFSNGLYQIQLAALDNTYFWYLGDWVTLNDQPQLIELHWQAATAPGANDGSATLWVDGFLQDQLTNLNNDARNITKIRLGPLGGIDSGTSGTYFFDDFQSWR
jgi:hypothetical protein